MGLNKNDNVTLVITDFTDAGLGVGRSDGFPVFTAGAVIGDTVRAHITKVKKHYAYARTAEILSPSKDRVPAACPSFLQCGSCQFLHYSYEAQLRYKEQKIRDAFVRIGGFDEEEISAALHPIAGMEQPFRYRNKAQYPVGEAVFADTEPARRETVFGFYAPRSHRVVPVDDCLTGPEENKKILRAVKESMLLADVVPYHEEDGTGHVRHILIRKAFATGQIMVCLVVNAKEALSRFRDVLILQLTELSGVSSICFNYNMRRDNVIMGDLTETIYGKPYIEDELCGLRFRISAPSFYQVNPVMTRTLYETVCRFALEGLPSGMAEPVVWDLYCGIGTISLTLAKNGAGRVYGVEVVPEAVRDAKENAALNGLENALFTEGRAEDLLPEAQGGSPEREEDADKPNLPPPDVVVVDPPRKGCEEKLLKALLDAKPFRIVYVSCDPATLARDCNTLCADKSYRIVEIQPCDMFPHSVHMESVTLLQRRD